jgi:sugar/nucleoside kinase (ribokinase family)
MTGGAGDLNPDVVLTGVPAELDAGQHERLVSAAVLTVGGSAGIVACGAARLGLRTAFASIVGDDDAGRYVLHELAARGVDVGGVVVQGGLPTALSVSLVRGARHDRAILTAPGCIPLFEAAMVDRTLLGSARHLHVTSYFLQPRLAAGLQGLFEEAHAAGLSTSLDCNDDPANEWDQGIVEILPSVDVLFANRHEALALTGRGAGRAPAPAERAPGDASAVSSRTAAAQAKHEAARGERGPARGELEAALAELASTGTLPIVKLGDSGALAWSSETITSMPALPVAVLDTVGAGDSFATGFLHAWLRDCDLARSLAFGVACGSLSTRALGGIEAQATLDEASAAAERLLAGPAGEGGS